MKHEFRNNAPWVRLACAVAALSVTLSVAGLIDFLATGYSVAADLLYGPVQTAEQKS